MSVFKSVLHIFSKKTNSFNVYHPETESAQVTDWNTGIVNTLASTGLSSIVNVLSSDSLLALLIKKVFDAMGVKYSLGQNGYVCWGALFGRVITQWGELNYYGNGDGMAYTPPLTTTTIMLGVAGDNGGVHPVGINGGSVYATGTTGVSYILICK